MERLTVHIGDTVGMAWELEEKYTMDEWVNMLQTRLCKYEDTGMMPEEIEEILEMMEKGVAFEVSKICTIEGTSIPRLRELAEADKEGRLVIVPPPAKEGDPKPSCFFNDTGGLWCNGMAPVDGDEPTERCKQCWYCEFGYDALKEE